MNASPIASKRPRDRHQIDPYPLALISPLGVGPRTALANPPDLGSLIQRRHTYAKLEDEN